MESTTNSGLVIHRSADPRRTTGVTEPPAEPVLTADVVETTQSATVTPFGPQRWAGWPTDWGPPMWSSGGGWWGRVEQLTDTAWMCMDRNASVIATMPPYLVGAAKSLNADWLNNPDPSVYRSWLQFAHQLFWDFQLGEAFVMPTALVRHGVAVPVPCRAAVAGDDRHASTGCRGTRSAASTSPT